MKLNILHLKSLHTRRGACIAGFVPDFIKYPGDVQYASLFIPVFTSTFQKLHKAPMICNITCFTPIPTMCVSVCS